MKNQPIPLTLNEIHKQNYEFRVIGLGRLGIIQDNKKQNEKKKFFRKGPNKNIFFSLHDTDQSRIQPLSYQTIPTAWYFLTSKQA